MEGENKSDYKSDVSVVGDIEQNMIGNSHPNPTHVSFRLAEASPAPVRASSTPVPPSTPLLSMLKRSIIVLVYIALSPPYVLAVMIYVLWSGTKCLDSHTVKDRSSTKLSLYEPLHGHTPNQMKFRTRSVTVTCRLGFLLLLWLALTITLHPFPSLKTATFLGLIHWKWSLLAAFLVLSYPFIFLILALYGSVYNKYLVDEDDNSQARYAGYYIGSGMLDSVTYLLHAISVFVLWMLYYHGTGLDVGFDKHATRTLSALLVLAFMWLLKAGLLLRWKQKAVYEKFRGRILMSGFRLFVLCRVIDGTASPLLLPCRFQQINSEMHIREYVDVAPSSSGKRNAREYVVSSPWVTLQQMKTVAELLTKLSKSRSMEDTYQLLHVMDAYQQKIAISFTYPNEATTESIIKHSMTAKSNQLLLADELQAEYPSKELNQVPFDKWVASANVSQYQHQALAALLNIQVEAHKLCLSVAYTLVDAFAMVSVLDKILTSCIVVVFVIVCLLVTELATTTTLLVVIASPFLALSFVFGDMSKTFFQGFIFAFITHPFSIGDRCTIDEVEVEVKHVSIMTTTCLKIGTNEHMLYPNSSLATKLIINHGDKLDPTDVIELVLHPSTKICDILRIQEHVENFVDSDEQREFFEKARRVVVKEMANGTTLKLYFQHTIDGKDVCNSQFFEKKETQRSILFIEIKRFLEALGVEVATP